MKRIIVFSLAALVTTCSWAQGTFTIRRPVEGSTVREVVKVRIPKNSIPEGGYIGVYVNGKFVEAALPDIEGEDYVYKLNSQAKDESGQARYADGPAKLEVVLYVDVNGKPQVVNRSSVNVTIDNHSSIRVPANGLKLRYSFRPGVERVYSYNFTQEVGMVSQAQAALGSRPSSVTTEDMKLRILYATDNAYTVSGGRQGLLRIQILPDKGKDYATVIPPGETEAKQVSQDALTPIFMRVTDVGREVFTSLPVYFGLDGQSAAPPQVEYFPLLPLPVLPTKAVKPGDVWQASELFARIGPEKAYEEQRLTIPVPARGELEGLVWYKGMPCAMIRTVISVGPELLKNVKNLNNVKGDASNVSLTGRTWFAIDRGAVVRMEVDLIQESLVEVGGGGTGGGGGAGAGISGGGQNVSGGGERGDGIGGPPAGGGMILDPSGKMFTIDPQVDKNGGVTIFQMGGKGRARGGMVPGEGGQEGEAGARGGQNPSGRFGQRNAGAGGGARKMVMRVRLSYVAELEQ